MLFEAGIGDAYGAAFEYVDPTLERPNDLKGYYGHPRHPIGNGDYTDDVEMSTAVAEAMLAGRNLTRESLAHWFVTAFHRKQRPGYANGFFNFLKTIHTGQEFLDKINPLSDKSGAAMRGWVTGLYPLMDDVLNYAELQAKLTHDTPDGIKSAQAAALFTHFFAYNNGKKKFGAEYVATWIDGPWTTPRTKPVGPKGMDSVHGAIQAVMMHDKMSLILKQCVDFTGDVDTVATIALGAASFSKEIEQDLPFELTGWLETGPWGGNYLLDLDKKLFQAFLI